MGKREDSNYQTLADFARFVGVDRTTVLKWVKDGKIKSRKKKPSNKRHRLALRNFTEVNKKRFAKPYPKYSKSWSDTEMYVLRTWSGTDEGLAKAVGRSVNAVRIKRSRLYWRKDGDASV